MKEKVKLFITFCEKDKNLILIQYHPKAYLVGTVFKMALNIGWITQNYPFKGIH